MIGVLARCVGQTTGVWSEVRRAISLELEVLGEPCLHKHISGVRAHRLGTPDLERVVLIQPEDLLAAKHATLVGRHLTIILTAMIQPGELEETVGHRLEGRVASEYTK